MRHIPEDMVVRSINTKWKHDAAGLMEKIREMPPEDRRQAIKKGDEVWAKVKEALALCSNGKCWYCESIQERSDGAVDHYRPKGPVKDCVGHEGYWWLAFDWHNYRFSCTFCNSRRTDLVTGNTGGKGNYFPLLDESKRAVSPDDRLDDEEPCLLDPMRATDPMLLWFNEFGEAISKYTATKSQKNYERASRSIELYNLNHERIREERMVISNEIYNLVNRANFLFLPSLNGDADALEKLEMIFSQLRSYIGPQAKYSAAARASLRGLRNEDSEWIDELLATA